MIREERGHPAAMITEKRGHPALMIRGELAARAEALA
jgi:hypothetical protein